MPIINKNIERPINILINFLFIIVFIKVHKKAVIFKAIMTADGATSHDAKVILDINHQLRYLEVLLHFPQVTPCFLSLLFARNNAE